MELYDTEEQQVEAIKDWWKENGKAVALGAVVGLGGIFGWRYYQDMQVSAQDAASQAYTSALTTLQAQGAGGIEATQNFIVCKWRLTIFWYWPLCNLLKRK